MSSRLLHETDLEHSLRETATSVALRVIDENEPSSLDPEAKSFQLPLFPPSYKEAIAQLQNQRRKPLLPTPPQRQPRQPLQPMYLMQQRQPRQPLQPMYLMQQRQPLVLIPAPAAQNWYRTQHKTTTPTPVRSVQHDGTGTNLIITFKCK